MIPCSHSLAENGQLVVQLLSGFFSLWWRNKSFRSRNQRQNQIQKSFLMNNPLTLQLRRCCVRLIDRWLKKPCLFLLNAFFFFSLQISRKPDINEKIIIRVAAKSLFVSKSHHELKFWFDCLMQCPKTMYQNPLRSPLNTFCSWWIKELPDNY